MSSSETKLAGSVEEILGEPRLGRLRRVDLRQIWPDAQRQLAPWLRTSPDLLGEALRLDIRRSEGDVLPEAIGELTPGLPVVVKPRFEQLSDGDVRELAGLVAELDAAVVVLMAPAIAEAFRQKLTKLNRNTAKVITFYGVEFDVWQIDDSAPAPVFRVVAGPEGWDKAPSQTPETRGSAATTPPSAPATAT
jgi:hypothetical protein